MRQLVKKREYFVYKSFLKVVSCFFKICLLNLNKSIKDWEEIIKPFVLSIKILNVILLSHVQIYILRHIIIDLKIL